MKKEAKKPLRKAIRRRTVASKTAAKKKAPARRAPASTPGGAPAVSRQAPASRNLALAAAKQEIPLRETKVEEAKFYTGPVSRPVAERSTVGELSYRELSEGYDEDALVLQVRDPWWGHIYWDVSKATWGRLRHEYPGDFDKAAWVLRAYDVSYIRFDGTNAHRFFDTGVDFGARNWYLNFGAPGTSWCVDLGVFLPDGRFVTVLRSNMVTLPLDGPSWVTDEEWMIPDDEFRRLYGMSVGLGPNVSSPVGKLWQERLKKDISSGAVSSFASPVKKPKEKGEFWLVVDCELIVYGATEPDARVTVQGQSIKLRKDGTFTLRFALPDGKQEIPVEARSAKIDEKRLITPVVTRKTTRNP